MQEYFIPVPQKIGNHKTKIEKIPQSNGYNITIVTYHNTDIVKIQESRQKITVTLDTGGWDTLTTKRRMNQVSQYYGLGFHVYHKNNLLLVDIQDQTYKYDGQVFILNLGKECDIMFRRSVTVS